jgi:2-dehydropantoate 2-reductase
MRAIIYGAGGIGCVVGGHLALTGTDVVLIGRPGHMGAIRDNGLRFVTPAATHTLRLPAVTAPDQVNFGPDDVVLLCAKGQNTEEALHDLRAVTEDVPIFCLQNGVINEETASGIFPRVYGVMVRVGAIYVEDGEVIARRDPPGWLIIGRYPAGEDDLARELASRLSQAGFFTMTTPDVMPYKWGKLILNLGNAVGAITNARPDETADIYRAARREAAELLGRAGIHWVSNDELARVWPESTSRPRGVIHNEAQSSTWQSLARRQGTVETDFLNGEIVRLAAKLGTRAPVNEALLRIVREMADNGETPGRHAPEELTRLVGIA